jgi:hypothetical protein
LVHLLPFFWWLESGLPISFSDLESLPSCLLGADYPAERPRQDDSAWIAVGTRRAAQGECWLGSITRRSVFAGTMNFLPNASGVWPLPSTSGR